MKNSRSLRLVLSRGLLGSALLASPVFALSSAELDSLRTKADRGNAIAQYNLGLAYADRRESIYDPAQAYAWLSVAATNGTNGKALSELTSLLTPAQLAEGKKRFAALNASAVSPISAPASPIATAEPISTITATPVAASAAAAADAEPDQKKLSAELSAAWKENELLKSGLNAQLADANKRVAIAEAALASKDRQIASLQTRLTDATNATAAAPVGISAELASLRNERDQLQTVAANATTELTALRATQEKAVADQASLRAQLNRANTELAAAQRAQALVESEAASLKAAADRASAERLAVAAQLENATAELEKAKSAPAPVAAPEVISSTGLATLKADRDRLAESVKTLTEERDALTAQLAAAKAVLPDATAPAVVTAPIPAVPTPPVAPDNDSAARIADLEKSKLETDTKLEAALRSFTLQQAEIERLQKALASIDEERARTLTKLENATAELVSLRPQANSAATVSAEAETLRTQLAEARQTVSEQAAALNTANQNLADARKTVDTATTDLV
ncbi:MAG: hypothetical protein ABW223_07860, partial [Rariglobus sp.]